ncbi:MAG: 3-phosphoshikimate 1-carboxyvinyltransferase [Zetaproteobacteria bacterium]|nr:3-phosphoshikimate 1-carboxyvinyltransferase [Zetaproteobacteria bacterium]
MKSLSMRSLPRWQPSAQVYRIPGSKSVTNRALLLAGLGTTPVTLSNVLQSEDTQTMFDALTEMGVGWQHLQGGQLHVTPSVGREIGERHIYVANAGTVARFLLPVLAATPGVWVLRGTPRMHQRPIQPLVTALNEAGAAITYLQREGFFPLQITGAALRLDRPFCLPNQVSSQFVSGLMYLAVVTGKRVTLGNLSGLVSRPYVELSRAVFRGFGFQSHLDATGDVLQVEGVPTASPSQVFAIESDFSNASYFLAAAAIAGKEVRLQGLCAPSIQGDAQILEYLQRMGCSWEWLEDILIFRGAPQLQALQADLADCTDIAPTLAAVCAFAHGRSCLTGLQNMRYKECDRTTVVAQCLQSLGVQLNYDLHSWHIEGAPEGRGLRPVVFDPCEDHRMAMMFATLSAGVVGLRLLNPECVAKTFPDFFATFYQD